MGKCVFHKILEDSSVWVVCVHGEVCVHVHVCGCMVCSACMEESAFNNYYFEVCVKCDVIVQLLLILTKLLEIEH